MNHENRIPKEKRHIPLKYQMILGGIIAVLIPFALAGIIIHLQLTASLMDMTKEKSVHTAKDVAGLIEATLMQEIKLATAIAADRHIIEAARKEDYADIQSTLGTIYSKISRDYFTLFFLDKDGVSRADAYFRDNAGINLSKREYFQNAKMGKTSVAGPIPSLDPQRMGEPIVVVSAPIEDQGEFLGIIGIPYNMDFIIDIISEWQEGETGLAYMVNQEGLVLAHPNKSYILTLRLLDDPGTQKLGMLIKTRNAGVASYSFQGMNRIAGATYIPLTGWTVIYSQARKEIMEPVNRILFSISICGFLFLCLTIAFIIYFYSNLSAPIQKMMEMTRQITRHSTEIILQIGKDRKIIFANPAFEQITGIPCKSIVGTEPPLTNINNMPPSAIWNSLEHGVPWSGRITLRKGNAETITLDVMLLPYRDGNGAILGYVEIGRDVTQELVFEKRLQQAQKLEAIGTLAGGIAHDFNNILSGIFGYAELSLMNNPQNPQTEEYLHGIIKASERARDLVAQILTFSRQTEVELSPVLAKSIIKEILKLLRASIPASINIEANLQSDAIVLADPIQVHQIVMNLFTNAIHAIGKETGHIKLELLDFKADAEFATAHPGAQPGNHLLIRVSDSGCGITPEILEHIFEPFFTTKPQGQGTGLGLSVVHGMVSKLRGVITAYSEPGKGSVFSVFIPAIDAEAPAPASSLDSITPGSERILFVDDEAPIAIAMKSILENLGYHVTCFARGADALEFIKTNPGAADLIVTDYSMPELSGLAIAEKLKEAGIAIPIILTSGYIHQEMENAARQIGIEEIIGKPMNAYQLVGAIQRALSKS